MEILLILRHTPFYFKMFFKDGFWLVTLVMFAWWIIRNTKRIWTRTVFSQ